MKFNHTEEHKKRLSIANLGFNNPFFGRKHDEESRRKMSLAKLGKPSWNKGKKASLEARLNMSMAFKGRIISEETKKKLSIANSKPRPWQKNRNTPESRKKISLALKGIKRSPETIARMSEARRGEKSNLWKGGTSTLAIIIRGCCQYHEWREQCFKRDNYTCQICNKWGGKLNADHYPKAFSQILHENNILSFDDAMECAELWDLSNSRTLCVDCHIKTDNFGAKSIIKRLTV